MTEEIIKLESWKKMFNSGIFKSYLLEEKQLEKLHNFLKELLPKIEKNSEDPRISDNDKGELQRHQRNLSLLKTSIETEFEDRRLCLEDKKQKQGNDND